MLYGCDTPKVVSIRDKVNPIETAVSVNEVTLKNGIFIPSKLVIEQGTSLSFTNLDNAVYTVISNPHPSHNFFIDLYKVLHKGESYRYQFNKLGNFGVHTEENPSINMEIVVE